MSVTVSAIDVLMRKGLTSTDIAQIVQALVPQESDIVAQLVIDLANMDCPPAAILIAVQALGDDRAADRVKADRERTRRYRERRGLSDADWYALRNTVFARDGEICRYCGTVDGPFHCDHVVPLARGGTNDLTNLCVACGPCNSSKGDRLLSEWSPPKGGWIR